MKSQKKKKNKKKKDGYGDEGDTATTTTTEYYKRSICAWAQSAVGQELALKAAASGLCLVQLSPHWLLL